MWGRDSTSETPTLFNIYRHPSFYCTLFCCASQILYILQIEVLGQPSVEQFYQCYFSNSICSLYVSLSHFGNYYNISNVFLMRFVMMICGSELWCHQCNHDGVPTTVPEMMNSVGALCVLNAPPTSCFHISLPPLRPPCCLKHSNIEIRPTNNPIMASKWKEEFHVSQFKSKATND